MVWVFLMKNKSEAAQLFQEFCIYVTNHFTSGVKTIRSDNAPDLCEGPMKKFCADMGIIHQTTCSYTPQQNIIVERKHRHILEASRALFFQAKLPTKYWGECILSAVHIINRTPLKALDFISPYEKMFETAPPVDHLRVFGCLCFVSTVQ